MFISSAFRLSGTTTLLVWAAGEHHQTAWRAALEAHPQWPLALPFRRGELRVSPRNWYPASRQILARFERGAVIGQDHGRNSDFFGHGPEMMDIDVLPEKNCVVELLSRPEIFGALFH